MTIIEEPHNHNGASGSVTFIEKFHNYEVKAQEVFSRPDVSDSDVSDQDVSPLDFLDRTFP